MVGLLLFKDLTRSHAEDGRQSSLSKNFLVSGSCFAIMASSGSQNSGRTPSEGTSIPATPSGNVNISSSSTSFKYKLYPIEVIFPLS